jgi:feruloyl esterase
MLSALEAWVEQGKAPDSLVASKIQADKVVRTRRLCPYPRVAKYRGSGSSDEASSYACVASQ